MINRRLQAGCLHEFADFIYRHPQALLGFRTVHEIEQERQALKAIRGDYQDLQGARDRVSTVLAAVKR